MQLSLDASVAYDRWESPLDAIDEIASILGVEPHEFEEWLNDQAEQGQRIVENAASDPLAELFGAPTLADMIRENSMIVVGLVLAAQHVEV